MSTERNYWLERRITRRAAVLTGGAGATAFLVACGTNSSTKQQGQATSAAAAAATAPVAPSSASGLLPAATAQAATTKQPKLGGSLSVQVPTPPPSLDPYTQTSFLCAWMNGLSYSRLYRYRGGVPEVAPNDFSQEPDLALAMPEQPDQLQFVVKLKPGVKFHNGRTLTSDDVKYAINRYLTLDKSVHKPLLFFLDKIETPDPQTVVFKAKFPYADFVYMMGGNLATYISPKEHAEGPDAATKMMGTGPFLLTEFQTGVSLTFKKNPDYFDKPFPYVDEIKSYIVTDQTKRMADFIAKSVDLSYFFYPEERDQIKKSRPDAMVEGFDSPSEYVYMRTDKPPFNDKRVRQALSMAIDRKAIREAVYKGEGINDQAVFVALESLRIPVKDLGPAAKYWDYNPGEAKKLLEAAGQTTINTTWDHADASVYSQVYVDHSSLTQAQWKQVGVTAKDQLAPYAQYIGTTYQGQYEGVAHSPRAVPYWYDHLSDRFYWSADGQRSRINLSYVNNPTVNALLDKERGQFDLNARAATIKEIQLILAEEQYEIYYSTETRTYFWNPEIVNYRPAAWFPRTHFMRVWRNK